jgi:hypothetical protein
LGDSGSEGFKPLNREQRKNLWINPLLTQLKLVRKPEEKPDPNAYWDLIEASQLPERVGRIAAEINEAAGYHLLETLFFLPPQKSVLSVRFDRSRAKHSMDITIRESEIALRFSTSKRIAFGWERYFSSDSSGEGSTLVWEQVIRPEEVLEEHIQNWLTYLLSELNKEFRPDLASSSVGSAEADLTAALRKASA